MHRAENTLFHSFLRTYEQYKDEKAFIYRVEDLVFEVSYEKLFEDVLLLSRAFRAKMMSKGAKVMFLCDNRYEWIVTDLAIASLGAISVPRGSDTPTQELEYIIEHSEADFLIVENEELFLRHQAMISKQKLKAIFVLVAPKIHTILSNIYSYNDILKDKTISPSDKEAFIAAKNELDEDDIFTLIYTSGTTGIPKAVILSHKNIMHNIRVLPAIIALEHKDLWVSILPAWHIFERTVEHVAISKGCCILYSSIKTFAADLEQYRPTLVATVPRLWESMYTKINLTLEKQDPKKAKIFKQLIEISAIYNKAQRELKNELPIFEKRNFVTTCIDKTIAFFTLIALYPFNIFAKKRLSAVQQKFGGRLRLAISGGGTLPDYLDRWIDAIGIRIVNAYGMTECSPAIAGRALNCNTFSTLGLPVEGTELKIVDENGESVPAGIVGEIWVRGEQLSRGYYKNKEANESSFSKDGFLKTGDLGKLTINGELVITGRSKETIVLASGENIDPSRIESTLCMLPFISEAVLVGQDKKGLGMLIVADFERLKEYVEQHCNIAIQNISQVMEDKKIITKIKSEMNEFLNQANGFKPFEKLQNIHFLDQDFKVGEELTNTFKKKRYVIEKKYKEIIDSFLH